MDKMDKDKVKCPYCGSTNTAGIIYGMPIMSLIKEDLDAGRVILGGDEIEGEMPERKCKQCGREFLCAMLIF